MAVFIQIDVGFIDKQSVMLTEKTTRLLKKICFKIML